MLAMVQRNEPAENDNETENANMPRKFGVELEIIGGEMNMHGVAELLTTNGISCQAEGYNHAVTRHWKIVSDASLNGRNAMELVSPPLKGKKGLAEVANVAALLMQKRVSVNASCGLHVHVDAAGLNVNQFKNVAKLVAIHEEHLKAILPPSRRVTRWAAWPSNYMNGQTVADRVAAIDGISAMPQLLNLWGRDRYRAVNFESLSRHNTIEFRAHSGSVDAQKINAWVALCVGFVNRADTEKSLGMKWDCGKPRCFQDLVRLAGKRNEPYFFSRRAQFMSNAAADAEAPMPTAAEQAAVAARVARATRRAA